MGNGDVQVTNQEYKFYKERVLYWANFLGLNTWEINFFQQDHESRAGVNYNIKARIASFWYTTILSYDYQYPKWPACKQDIDNDAFHEVLEMLFADVRYWANERFGFCEDTMDIEIHKVIKHFERNVFPVLAGYKSIGREARRK